MGADARPAWFVLRPLSRRAIQFVRQRHRCSVCGLRAVGRGRLLALSQRDQADLERAGHWQALGLFDLKEHFVAIGLALLPAYWVCWQQQRTGEPSRTPAVLTLILAFIVWWSFLIGHVLNNIMGFGL